MRKQTFVELSGRLEHDQKPREKQGSLWNGWVFENMTRQKLIQIVRLKNAELTYHP